MIGVRNRFEPVRVLLNAMTGRRLPAGLVPESLRLSTVAPGTGTDQH
jgi:hypothetical protein